MYTGYFTVYHLQRATPCAFVYAFSGSNCGLPAFGFFFVYLLLAVPKCIPSALPAELSSISWFAEMVSDMLTAASLTIIAVDRRRTDGRKRGSSHISGHIAMDVRTQTWNMPL
jgi:hypothetical protein